ncbi:serine hydrolase [Candidatus Nomurabacteria bacterium]|nr:serine hydrolase [Candidatus Nomurabacteria bacterium]
MRRLNKLSFTITLLLIVSIIGNIILFNAVNSSNDIQDSSSSQSYRLLAKRLFLDNPNDKRINFSSLRSSFRQYFSDNSLSGSLYFEYLPTGTSVRVNPDVKYRAASLIKLPVAMELYKAKELGKVNLSDTIKLKQEWLNDGYGELYKKGAGYMLSLGEAVEILLTDSDNTALRAILDTTTPILEDQDRALGALDIELSMANDGSIDIGTRSYSSFLKCLYFACYNSKGDSQAILELLTKTSFDNRIVAGVDDKSIEIAHKIGVFNMQVQSDCGIVYLENNNYVICIMLEGNDDDTTNSHIANLSKLAYEYLAK